MEPTTFIEATSLHFGKITGKYYDKALVMLSREGLPIDDLSQETLLYGLYEDGEHLVGTAGLEVFGPVALLRSISVVTSKRRKGYGKYLMKGIEAVAKTRGVLKLYLLTTTASDFFKRNNYTTIERDEAPLAIRNTFEFSSLCPSTAVLMRKELVR